MKAKIRTCSICKIKKPVEEVFTTPVNKAYCSPECGAKLAIQVYAKQKETEKKEFKAETTKRKKALAVTTKTYWVDKIRAVLHPWIKLRDKDEPCISCSRFDSEIPDSPSGKWDAGHFRSQGAAKQLRFNPLNIHKQCFQCNRGGEMWSKKRDTVGINYEKNLIVKIGQDQVNELKFNNDIKRYSVDELKEIYSYWTEKLKEAKANDTRD